MLTFKEVMGVEPKDKISPILKKIGEIVGTAISDDPPYVFQGLLCLKIKIGYGGIQWADIKRGRKIAKKLGCKLHFTAREDCSYQFLAIPITQCACLQIPNSMRPRAPNLFNLSICPFCGNLNQ